MSYVSASHVSNHLGFIHGVHTDILYILLSISLQSDQSPPFLPIPSPGFLESCFFLLFRCLTTFFPTFSLHEMPFIYHVLKSLQNIKKTWCFEHCDKVTGVNLNMWHKHNIVIASWLLGIKKVKVSHSLLAIGAVGVRVPLYLGHSWWKAELIPLLSLPYPSLIRKRYPFTAGLTERVFQSPHGEAEPRTHTIRRLSAL